MSFITILQKVVLAVQLFPLEESIAKVITEELPEIFMMMSLAVEIQLMRQVLLLSGLLLIRSVGGAKQLASMAFVLI